MSQELGKPLSPPKISTLMSHWRVKIKNPRTRQLSIDSPAYSSEKSISGLQTSSAPANLQMRFKVGKQAYSSKNSIKSNQNMDNSSISSPSNKRRHSIAFVESEPKIVKLRRFSIATTCPTNELPSIKFAKKNMDDIENRVTPAQESKLPPVHTIVSQSQTPPSPDSDMKRMISNFLFFPPQENLHQKSKSKPLFI